MGFDRSLIGLDHLFSFVSILCFHPLNQRSQCPSPCNSWFLWFQNSVLKEAIDSERKLRLYEISRRDDQCQLLSDWTRDPTSFRDEMMRWWDPSSLKGPYFQNCEKPVCVLNKPSLECECLFLKKLNLLIGPGKKRRTNRLVSRTSK